MSGQEGQVDSTSDTCSFSFLLSSTQGIWCLLNHRFSIVGLRRDPNQNKEEISLQKIWQESQAGVQQGVNLFPFAPPFFTHFFPLFPTFGLIKVTKPTLAPTPPAIKDNTLIGWKSWDSTTLDKVNKTRADQLLCLAAGLTITCNNWPLSWW